MIKPTVGRVVWFYSRSDGATVPTALAAVVAYVHNDRKVNLMVIAEDGIPYGLTHVDLLQDGDTPQQSVWCAWMPYQLGQAARTEAAEKAASA
jgi:hypothetical protein